MELAVKDGEIARKGRIIRRMEIEAYKKKLSVRLQKFLSVALSVLATIEVSFGINKLIASFFNIKGCILIVLGFAAFIAVCILIFKGGD